jgi:hypothetical protein
MPSQLKANMVVGSANAVSKSSAADELGPAPCLIS